MQLFLLLLLLLPQQRLLLLMAGTRLVLPKHTAAV